MADIEISFIQVHPDLPPPSYAHDSDAGADLVSAEDVVLNPGQRIAVATGLHVAIPIGFVGLIHPRSGLALKHGISMVNTPGTIDSGYRGEIKVILINHDLENDFKIARGDRIAQLVIQKVEKANFVKVTNLEDTDRGTGGFGSTGVKS